MAFDKKVILLEGGQTLDQKMEPWQEEDFKALDSGQYRRVTGFLIPNAVYGERMGVLGGLRHAYLERPRGHSKTGDIGTEAVTELVLGPPCQRLYCCAADEDQAKLLFEDVAGKFRRSPLLRSQTRIKRPLCLNRLNHFNFQHNVPSLPCTLNVSKSRHKSGYGER